MRRKEKQAEGSFYGTDQCNLTFGYEGSYDTIFENVSFSIDTSWKFGFGKNGKGKTTFLQLLLGKYEYQGAITHSVVFDYFLVSGETKRSGTDSGS